MLYLLLASLRLNWLDVLKVGISRHHKCISRFRDEVLRVAKDETPMIQEVTVSII